MGPQTTYNLKDSLKEAHREGFTALVVYTLAWEKSTMKALAVKFYKDQGFQEHPYTQGALWKIVENWEHLKAWVVMADKVDGWDLEKPEGLEVLPSPDVARVAREVPPRHRPVIDKYMELGSIRGTARVMDMAPSSVHYIVREYVE